MYYPSTIHRYNWCTEYGGPGTFFLGKFLKSEGAEMEFPAYSAAILAENCCNRDINRKNFMIRTSSPIYFLSKNS